MFKKTIHFKNIKIGVNAILWIFQDKMIFLFLNITPMFLFKKIIIQYLFKEVYFVVSQMCKF